MNPITIPELQHRVRKLREELDFQKRLTHHATCEVRQGTATEIYHRDTIGKLNTHIQELEGKLDEARNAARHLWRCGMAEYYEPSKVVLGYAERWPWLAEDNADAATGHTCQWDYDDMDNRYDTDCGSAWMFTEGSLKANGVVFCPFCGGKVSEKENQ